MPITRLELALAFFICFILGMGATSTYYEYKYVKLTSQNETYREVCGASFKMLRGWK